MSGTGTGSPLLCFIVAHMSFNSASHLRKNSCTNFNYNSFFFLFCHSAIPCVCFESIHYEWISFYFLQTGKKIALKAKSIRISLKITQRARRTYYYITTIQSAGGEVSSSHRLLSVVYLRARSWQPHVLHISSVPINTSHQIDTPATKSSEAARC